MPPRRWMVVERSVDGLFVVNPFFFEGRQIRASEEGLGGNTLTTQHTIPWTLYCTRGGEGGVGFRVRSAACTRFVDVLIFLFFFVKP